MIMVNTEIALPTDKVASASVKNGIPAASTPLESRSVLRNKSVIDTLTNVGVKVTKCPNHQLFLLKTKSGTFSES